MRVGAAPAGVPRKARTRAAPGLRLAANRSRPPGAARQELADGGRRLSRGFFSQAPETVARPMKATASQRDGQRKARPGAV